MTACFMSCIVPELEAAPWTTLCHVSQVGEMWWREEVCVVRYIPYIVLCDGPDPKPPCATSFLTYCLIICFAVDDNVQVEIVLYC